MSAPTTSAGESLWLEAVPAAGFPHLDEDLDVDVAILGGGIAGVTAALLLKREGARVAVLEAAEVGSGVTGCTTAKVTALQATVLSTIRSRHGEEPTAVYAEASLAAVERVAALAHELQIDCDLDRRSALTYAADAQERAAVEQEMDAAVQANLPVELVDGLDDLPYAGAGAVRLRDQLQLHPVRYVRGLAAAISGDGCHVLEHTRALSVSDASPCEVRTEHGVVRAAQVVVATHYPVLDRGLYFSRLKVQRSYCIAARLASGAPPQSMAISAGSTTRSVRSHRELLIVGGEGHSAGSEEAQPERYERLEEFARTHWDVAEVTHRWSAQDPVPYDHLPMVGAYHPGSSRLWVATGFLKWGLSSATFAAEILAARIGGREHRWASTFSPTRLSLRSMHEVAQLGTKFSLDLVVDRVRPAQESSRDDVPAGEARVVRDGLGKIGVYRELDGELHAVSLRCTHMGCLLRWNGAERSWDCPCHGSRFDVDGQVLEGPAVNPLEPR